MPFWNKKPNSGNNKDKNKDGAPKKETLSEKFHRIGGNIRRKINFAEMGKITRHTLGDLKKPKEATGLAIAIIVPGGMFGWFAYRIQKYRMQKPANDNRAPDTSLAKNQPPPDQKAQKKPKGPKPPGTP